MGPFHRVIVEKRQGVDADVQFISKLTEVLDFVLPVNTPGSAVLRT